MQRHYLPRTLVLETRFETDGGEASLLDCMATGDGASHVVRIVRGLRGTVKMHTELIARFDYGSVVPWVSRLPDGRRQMTAGPDQLTLDTDVALRGEDLRTVGEFEVEAGQEVAFVLTWTPSFQPLPVRVNAQRLLARVEGFWRNWAAKFHPAGEWDEAVLRSLLTLKALAHRDTGGIVAAGTTSLPEQLGGPRNWDYRYCWLRDATFLVCPPAGRLSRGGEGLADMAAAGRRRQSRQAADHVRRSRGTPAHRVRGAVAARV